MNDIQQHSAKVAASLNQIGGLVSELHLPAGSPDSHIIGWTLVRLSFDHARSITSLFLNHGAELAGSAFALVRVMDEAFIRGAWFALHATDDDAAYFRRKDEMPPKKLTEEIEQHPPFNERKPFTQLRGNAWARFNSYTHSGTQAVGAYMDGSTLGPNFRDADTHLLLEHAEAMAINGVIVLVTTLETADPSQLPAQHERLNALLNIPAWQPPSWRGSQAYRGAAWRRRSRLRSFQALLPPEQRHDFKLLQFTRAKHETAQAMSATTMAG